MKRNIKVLSIVALASTICITTAFSVISFNKKEFIGIKGDESSYHLNMDSINRLSSSVDYASGTGDVFTKERGNRISFNYSSIKALNSGFQTLNGAEGSISNTSYLSGLKSISFISSSSSPLSIQYGWSADLLGPSQSLLANTVYSFDDKLPSFFCLKNENEEAFDITSISLSYSCSRSETPTYTITWKNYDNTTLETDLNVRYGEMPDYNDATPVKPSDDYFKYVFAGWSPKVSVATANVTYVAQFEEELEACTITFWQPGGSTYNNYYDSVIASFNEVHPNITVNSVGHGSFSNLNENLKRVIAGGNPQYLPSLSVVYSDYVASYLESGVVIPLDNFFESDESLDNEKIGYQLEDGSHVEGGETLYGVSDYGSVFNQGSQYADKGTFSVPLGSTTDVFYYNKTFFTNNDLPLPTKWTNDDDPNDLTALSNLSNKIKSIVNNASKKPFGIDNEPSFFINLSNQYGAPYLAHSDILAERFPFATSSDSKALSSMLKTWYDNGYFETYSIACSYLSTDFTNQTIYGYFGSEGSAGYSYTPDFEVGVAKIPQVDASNPVSFTNTQSVCLFDKDEAVEKASWLFYKHLSNAVNNAEFGIALSSPARVSSYEQVRYQDLMGGINPNTKVAYTNPSKELLVSQTKALVATLLNTYAVNPFIPQYEIARSAIQTMITNILLDNKTIDEAYAEALATCIA